MQWSLNAPNYMNLSIDDGFNYLKKLIYKQNMEVISRLVHNDELGDLGENFEKIQIILLEQC